MLIPLEHVRIASKFDKRTYEVENDKLIFEYSGEGEFWKLKISYKPKKGHVVVEEHVERGYNPEDIINLLKQCNFTIRLVFGDDMRKIKIQKKIFPLEYFYMSRKISG